MQQLEEITEAIMARKVRVKFIDTAHAGSDHWMRFFNRAMELAEIARERATMISDDRKVSDSFTAGLV